MLKKDVLKICIDALNEDRNMTIINDRTKILHRVEIDNDWLWDSDSFIRGSKDSGLLIYSVLLHDDKYVKGFVFRRNNPFDEQKDKYVGYGNFLIPGKHVKKRVREDIKEYAKNL